MQPRAVVPPALGHNTRDSKAYALFTVCGLLVVTFPGTLLGAGIAYAVWRITQPDLVTRWLVAGLAAASVAALQPAVALIWSWNLLAQLVAPANSTGFSGGEILASLPAEMLLGPLVLVGIQLGIAYRRDTIHGEEWARYNQVANRKRALERGWPGPDGGAASTGDVNAHPSGEIRLGVATESGLPFDLGADDIAQHVFIPGASGTGKTTTLVRLADGALAAGYGVVIIDCKGVGLGREARTLATHHSVPFTIVDPQDTSSVGYNPCSGDAPTIANKLIGAFSFSGDAEIYKQVAMEVIPVICREAGGVDDEVAPEAPVARRAFLPSSMGLSILVPAAVKRLDVIVRWGDYRPEAPSRSGETPPDPEGEADDTPGNGFHFWRRVQQESQLTVDVAEGLREHPVPDSGGLAIATSARSVGPRATVDGGVPPGTQSVSIFLVNRRPPAPDETRDTAFAFQAQIEVSAGVPFVARPDLKGLESAEWDDRVADLQYRDVGEFAVGHGASTEADVDGEGSSRTVRTVWIPSAEVERVAPEAIPSAELGMEALGSLPDATAARESLAALVTRYREWIAGQEATLEPTLTDRRRQAVDELLRRASVAADRIEAGIALLEDPDVFEAFRVANRAMAAAARRRAAILRDIAPDAVEVPAWRPFQLAFLLTNLRGIADPLHADRDVVDLLFFPTGGGKTEAYLGLAAFTLVLRRLRNEGLAAAGVSVLMRYTLRLLTLDQLARGAALVCALELERERDPSRLDRMEP
jgi:Type IV secretion-system coupling protein DNA-binding domain